MTSTYDLIKSILNINEEINGKVRSVSFREKDLENRFKENENKTTTSSQFIHSTLTFLCSLLNVYNAITIFGLNLYSYFCLICTVLELVFFVIFCITYWKLQAKPIRNSNSLIVFRYIILIIQNTISIFYCFFSEYSNIMYFLIKLIYFTIIAKNICYLAVLPDNLFIGIICHMYLLIFFIVFCYFSNTLPNQSNSSTNFYEKTDIRNIFYSASSSITFSDYLLELSASIIIFFLKRYLGIERRRSFLKKYKFEKFFNYCDELICGLSYYHISFIKNEMFFINRKLKKFLGNNFKNEEKIIDLKKSISLGVNGHFPEMKNDNQTNFLHSDSNAFTETDFYSKYFFEDNRSEGKSRRIENYKYDCNYDYEREKKINEEKFQLFEFMQNLKLCQNDNYNFFQIVNVLLDNQSENEYERTLKNDQKDKNKFQNCIINKEPKIETGKNKINGIFNQKKSKSEYIQKNIVSRFKSKVKSCILESAERKKCENTDSESCFDHYKITNSKEIVNNINEEKNKINNKDDSGDLNENFDSSVKKFIILENMSNNKISRFKKLNSLVDNNLKIITEENNDIKAKKNHENDNKNINESKYVDENSNCINKKKNQNELSLNDEKSKILQLIEKNNIEHEKENLFDFQVNRQINKMKVTNKTSEKSIKIDLKHAMNEKNENKNFGKIKKTRTIINNNNFEIKNTLESLNFEKDSQIQPIKEIIIKKKDYSHKTIKIDNQKNRGDFLNENEFDKKIESFKIIGQFYIVINDKKKFYLIYYRKINNVLDIFINNSTDIKNNEQMESENKLKHKILSKIAHEFKTPINSILGLINNLKAYYRRSVINRELDIIQSLSNYTLYLISDVIQYASNDSVTNKMYSNNKIILQDANLKNLNVNLLSLEVKKNLFFCFDILNALLICHETKNQLIETELHIEDKLHNFKIINDEKAINQIVLNLISNSVKFTKRGKIAIIANFVEKKIKSEREEKEEKKGIVNKFFKEQKNIFSKLSSKDLQKKSFSLNYPTKIKQMELHNKVKDEIKYFLKISVLDTGIGISEEKQNIIFNKDMKLNTEHDFNHQGSGLGLSICMNLLKMLNVRIIFSSRENVGSLFSLLIPAIKISNDSNLNVNKESTLFANIYNKNKFSSKNLIDNPKINKQKTKFNSYKNDISRNETLSKNQDFSNIFNQINNNINKEKINKKSFSKNYSLDSNLFAFHYKRSILEKSSPDFLLKNDIGENNILKIEDVNLISNKKKSNFFKFKFKSSRIVNCFPKDIKMNEFSSDELSDNDKPRGKKLNEVKTTNNIIPKSCINEQRESCNLIHTYKDNKEDMKHMRELHKIKNFMKKKVSNFNINNNLNLKKKTFSEENIQNSNVIISEISNSNDFNIYENFLMKYDDKRNEFHNYNRKSFDNFSSSMSNLFRNKTQKYSEFDSYVMKNIENKSRNNPSSPILNLNSNLILDDLKVDFEDSELIIKTDDYQLIFGMAESLTKEKNVENNCNISIKTTEDHLSQNLFLQNKLTNNTKENEDNKIERGREEIQNFSNSNQTNPNISIGNSKIKSEETINNPVISLIVNTNTNSISNNLNNQIIHNSKETNEYLKIFNSRNFLFFKYDENYLLQKSASFANSASFTCNGTTNLTNTIIGFNQYNPNFQSIVNLKNNNNTLSNIPQNSNYLNSNRRKNNFTNNTLISNNFPKPLDRYQTGDSDSQIMKNLGNSNRNSNPGSDKQKSSRNNENENSINLKNLFFEKKANEFNPITKLSCNSGVSEAESLKTNLMDEIKFDNLRINLHEELRINDSRYSEVDDKDYTNFKNINNISNNIFQVNQQGLKKDLQKSIMEMKNNMFNSRNNGTIFSFNQNFIENNMNTIKNNVSCNRKDDDSSHSNQECKPLNNKIFQDINLSKENEMIYETFKRDTKKNNNMSYTVFISRAKNNFLNEDIINFNKKNMLERNYREISNKYNKKERYKSKGEFSYNFNNKMNEYRDNYSNNPYNVNNQFRPDSSGFYIPYNFNMLFNDNKNLSNSNSIFRNKLNEDLKFKKTMNSNEYKNQNTSNNKYINDWFEKYSNNLNNKGEFYVNHYNNVKNINNYYNINKSPDVNTNIITNMNINELLGSIKKEILEEWKKSLKLDNAENFSFIGKRKYNIENNLDVEWINNSVNLIKINGNNISMRNQDVCDNQPDNQNNINDKKLKLSIDKLNSINKTLTPRLDKKTKEIFIKNGPDLNEINKNTNIDSGITSNKISDSYVFLVIDDNVIIRNSVKNALRSILKGFKLKNIITKDFEIFDGGDGIDALKFLIDPNIGTRVKGLFIDENMEYLNGSETIKIIRNFQKLDKLRKFKIASVTAFEDPDTRSNILQAGVDQIFTKPLKKNDLEAFFEKNPIKD